MIVVRAIVFMQINVVFIGILRKRDDRKEDKELK